MIEEEIAAHVRELLAATADADSEGVLNSTLALDTLRAERGSEIDARLRHFLENRSYQKALAYIEGRQGS